MRYLSLLFVLVTAGRMPSVAMAVGAGVTLVVLGLMVFAVSYFQHQIARFIMRAAWNVWFHVRQWSLTTRLIDDIHRCWHWITSKLPGWMRQSSSRKPSRILQRLFARLAKRAPWAPCLSPIGNGMAFSAGIAEAQGLERHSAALKAATANTVPVLIAYVVAALISWQLAAIIGVVALIGFLAYRLYHTEPTPTPIS